MREYWHYSKRAQQLASKATRDHEQGGGTAPRPEPCDTGGTTC
jgi:hypothetical protein